MMPQPDTMRRTALILVTISLVWNLGEAVAAFWAGALSASVVLLAFGADSVIELFASGVLVWRLVGERDGGEDDAAEHRAQKLIGLTFFILAAYILVHSGASLLGWLPRPQPSLFGVGIAVVSAVAMSILYVAKMRLAARMQSRALRAEAVESLFCDLQDLAVLVGLVFHVLLAWWWADPVASLMLIPFFIKEGRENFFQEHEDDEDEDEARQVCFCRSCFFGVTTCRAACCLA